MEKLKITSVVGTRPEIIRLSRVLIKLDQYCEHTLIHTGQNYDYELNQIFFDDLGIRKPDYFLNSAHESRNAANTIGNIITNVDQVLEEINPEALLILGDTNSCLAAISAKRRKIPIFHMEAGNRSFDQRVPEEINRKIVDHIADVNMTYSSIARDYLLSENIPPDMVIKIGSPMYEVLNCYKSQIDLSKILSQLNLNENDYYLVSAHREENIEPLKSFNNLIDILNLLARDYAKPIIVTTHPRTQKRISEAKVKLNPLIKLLKPLGFFDYIKLQQSAITVLSDSGTINEESSLLNFPALNIREAHERPEAMEEAAVMMVGFNYARIKQALLVLSNQSRGGIRDLKLVDDYNTPNVSEKVIRIIYSYTDYINRKVWKKY